ncbi:MAG: peptidase T [Erysipelotrichaceae bacterium]
MDIVERFIGYTKIDTTSSETSKTVPSSANQLVLAKLLQQQLLQLNLSDVSVDANGFVYATLKSNCSKECNSVGFLAHMDTSNAASGKNIKARIIENYDGKDICLSKGQYCLVKDYPFLTDLQGQDLIVTDGKTLLGGDDKAGIAIIMDMLQNLQANPDIKHGRIEVCFTVDEEIGEGIHHIDLERFKCDYAYTLDGGPIDRISYENFNAASAVVEIKGNSIHPGSAKNKMINASQLLIDFHNMLPVNQRAEYTENREGFNHLLYMNSQCESGQSVYIIRNHDKQLLLKQMQQFKDIETYLNKSYGRKVCKVKLERTYNNMLETIKDKMYIIDNAKEAFQNNGIDVEFEPIRGGTDGSTLSFMGIVTPNLPTGGYNFHGTRELVSINQMKKMSAILVDLCQIIVEKGIEK